MQVTVLANSPQSADGLASLPGVPESKSLRTAAGVVYDPVQKAPTAISGASPPGVPLTEPQQQQQQPARYGPGSPTGTRRLNKAAASGGSLPAQGDSPEREKPTSPVTANNTESPGDPTSKGDSAPPDGAGRQTQYMLSSARPSRDSVASNDMRRQLGEEDLLESNVRPGCFGSFCIGLTRFCQALFLPWLVTVGFGLVVAAALLVLFLVSSNDLRWIPVTICLAGFSLVFILRAFYTMRYFSRAREELGRLLLNAGPRGGGGNPAFDPMGLFNPDPFIRDLQQTLWTALETIPSSPMAHDPLLVVREDIDKAQKPQLKDFGFLAADAKGSILWVNEMLAARLGYEPIDLLDQNVSALTPEPYCVYHDSYMRHFIETGVVSILGKEREVPIRTKSGEIIFGMMLIEPRLKGVPNVPIQRSREDPSVWHVFCDWETLFWARFRFKDSDPALNAFRNKVQPSPATSNQSVVKEAAQVFQYHSDAVLVTDIRGKVIFANEPAGVLFVCPVSEIVGSNVKRFMDEPIRIKHDLFIQRYIDHYLAIEAGQLPPQQQSLSHRTTASAAPATQPIPGITTSLSTGSSGGGGGNVTTNTAKRTSFTNLDSQKLAFSNPSVNPTPSMSSSLGSRQPSQGGVPMSVSAVAEEVSAPTPIAPAGTASTFVPPSPTASSTVPSPTPRNRVIGNGRDVTILTQRGDLVRVFMVLNRIDRIGQGVENCIIVGVFRAVEGRMQKVTARSASPMHSPHSSIRGSETRSFVQRTTSQVRPGSPGYRKSRPPALPKLPSLTGLGKQETAATMMSPLASTRRRGSVTVSTIGAGLNHSLTLPFSARMLDGGGGAIGVGDGSSSPPSQPRGTGTARTAGGSSRTPHATSRPPVSAVGSVVLITPIILPPLAPVDPSSSDPIVTSSTALHSPWGASSTATNPGSPAALPLPAPVVPLSHSPQHHHHHGTRENHPAKPSSRLGVNPAWAPHSISRESSFSASASSSSLHREAGGGGGGRVACSTAGATPAAGHEWIMDLLTLCERTALANRGVFSHFHGNVIVLSFNASSLNASHRHSACEAQSALLTAWKESKYSSENTPLGGPVRLVTAVVFGVLISGIFHGHEVLMGRPLEVAHAALQLGVQAGADCLIDHDIHGTVHYSFETRPVNVLFPPPSPTPEMLPETETKSHSLQPSTVRPPGGGILIHQVICRKVMEEEEWMYGLAMSEANDVYAPWRNMFRLVREDNFAEATAALQTHMSKFQNDPLALWMQQRLQKKISGKGELHCSVSSCIGGPEQVFSFLV